MAPSVVYRRRSRLRDLPQVCNLVQMTTEFTSLALSLWCNLAEMFELDDYNEYLEWELNQHQPRSLGEEASESEELQGQPLQQLPLPV